MNANVTKRGRHYIADGFTTIIELRWRYHLLLYISTFVATWTVFALAYLSIAARHGDVGLSGGDSDDALTDKGNLTTTTSADPVSDVDDVPCVKNVHDFTSAFLFSIETQTTIGYGVRVIDTVCPDAIIVMMVQTVTGILVQAIVTGIIFSKVKDFF